MDRLSNIIVQCKMNSKIPNGPDIKLHLYKVPTTCKAENYIILHELVMLAIIVVF